MKTCTGTLTVDGPLDKEGMVVDFAVLKQIVSKQVLSKLDHQTINDTIKVPSAENISVWIWNQIVDVSELPNEVRLHEVKLWETPNSFVTYYGK